MIRYAHLQSGTILYCSHDDPPFVLDFLKPSLKQYFILVFWISECVITFNWNETVVLLPSPQSQPGGHGPHINFEG